MNDAVTETTPDLIGAATYSPEDNKLRLYPFSRLDRETYDLVKTAGFSWAPKQELFVAPMWTPEREDLLCELCGEIGDEDKSLAERAEERAERFETYSENRGRDAEKARKAVSAIADNIPLGQPILVGHHSERHARKDAERIENGMRKAVKMWEQSNYWASRAQGAIRSARYKERSDVRARRIKKLEAENRKRERAKAEAEHLIRFWSGELKAKNPATGESRQIEITEANRDFLRGLLGRMPACGVQVRGIDGQSWFSAWDCLQPDGERYQNCPSKTVAELQESALRLQAQVIERQNRWLAHYGNRLAYERAMLAADGGTVTDKTGPEVGGAVRCWASPGYGKAWAFIQKVNKVTVTILYKPNYGDLLFRQNMPFDKLHAVMTKAQVDEARASGRMVGEDKVGFFLSGAEPEAPKEPAKPQTDSQDFRAMRQALRDGVAVQVVAAPQLFPTPADVAERMADLADLSAGDRVLEPSAGTGNLIKAIRARGIFREDCVAVEINRQLAEALQAHTGDVHCADFLQCNGDLGKFNRIVMNPPFANGADIRHIKHALGFLEPGGKLVAICAGGPRQEAELQPLADSWEPLPDGTFKEQGTNVRTVLATFTA